MEMRKSRGSAQEIEHQKGRGIIGWVSLHLPQRNSPDPFLKIALCLHFESHIGSWAQARVF